MLILRIYLPGLTIAGEASMVPSASYPLTPSSSVVSSSRDIIEIQLKDLATSISDTFISVSESFAQDVFGTTSPAYLLLWKF